MQLFHYHWWTPKVEEMERAYHDLGFETVQRVGRVNGEMQTFNPPKQWEDFKGKDITFRIVEMVKGQSNITFGYGKRDQFDHIGILVDEEEYVEVIRRAEELMWRVSEGERRTFILTPWKFRIELQKRKDVVKEQMETILTSIQLHLPFKDRHPEQIGTLLNLAMHHSGGGKGIVGNDQWNIELYDNEQTFLNAASFCKDHFQLVDPVGTQLIAN